MAYGSKILTSIFGRRLGLQRLTTAETGGSKTEFLVGPDDFRVGVSTAETTSTDLKPFGVSHIAGSSAVFTLEPPIPGVRKVISVDASSASPYLKTKNGETIVSTAGSSHTTIKATSVTKGAFELIGLTTSQWLSLDLAGFTKSTST